MWIYKKQKLKSDYDATDEARDNEISSNEVDFLYFLEVLTIKSVTIHFHFPSSVYRALNIYQIPLHLYLETDYLRTLLKRWSWMKPLLGGANIQKLGGLQLEDEVDISGDIFSKVMECNLAIGSIEKLTEAIKEMPLVRAFKLDLIQDGGRDYVDEIVTLLSSNPHIDSIILISYNHSLSNKDSEILNLFRELPDYIRRRIDVFYTEDSMEWSSTKKILQMTDRMWEKSSLFKKFRSSPEI